MVKTDYIYERDELNIQFKEYEQVYCIKLKSGIVLEFGDDDELSNIVLPNFCQMIRKQPIPQIPIEYDHAIFEDYTLTLVLKLHQQSINVKIDLNAIDK